MKTGISRASDENRRSDPGTPTPDKVKVKASTIAGREEASTVGKSLTTSLNSTAPRASSNLNTARPPSGVSANGTTRENNPSSEADVSAAENAESPAETCSDADTPTPGSVEPDTTRAGGHASANDAEPNCSGTTGAAEVDEEAGDDEDDDTEGDVVEGDGADHDGTVEEDSGEEL